MYTANFSKTEKRIISQAAEIEISYLMDMAEQKGIMKESFYNVVNMLKYHNIENAKTEVSLQIFEVIQDFEKLKDNPEILFSMPIEHIDLITLILAEHFEDEWAEHEDDVEFAALCYKIIHITELIDNNNQNLN